MNAHEHGPHECYCPACGHTEQVAEDKRCNTLSCPVCGQRMRASETGERRSLRVGTAVSQEEGPPLWLILGGTLAILGVGFFLISKFAPK